MAITAISSDFAQDPRTVRITTTDNLATITASGYITDEEDNIKSLNNGEFTFLDSDICIIDYSDGEGLFTVDSNNNTFVAETDPGTLSETLADGNIFVGDATNVAAGVAMSGDIAIDNTGATTIQAGAVELGMLDAGVAPSHVVKFAAQATTAGGAAAEAITVTGALATDLAFVQMVDDGTNNVTIVDAVVTADTLTITFSADPGNDCVVNYQLLRAAA